MRTCNPHVPPVTPLRADDHNPPIPEPTGEHMLDHRCHIALQSRIAGVVHLDRYSHTKSLRQSHCCRRHPHWTVQHKGAAGMCRGISLKSLPQVRYKKNQAVRKTTLNLSRPSGPAATPGIARSDCGAMYDSANNNGCCRLVRRGSQFCAARDRRSRQTIPPWAALFSLQGILRSRTHRLSHLRMHPESSTSEPHPTLELTCRLADTGLP